MNTANKVFIIGPGFIGWNVLELLVGEGYTVTGLVRRDKHAEQIRTSGALAVKGDLNDHGLIVKHVLEHDIIIHTATADHLPSVEAVLDGIKQRAAASKSTIFIHTSGTSVLDDDAFGAYKSDKIYYDNDPESINKLPDTAPHRQIDLAIVRASKELGDKAKLAIMIPPEIYGFNPQHRRLTIQVPTVARFALKHGFAGHVGKGLSVESQIHVLDLARAYIVLLHHMEESPASVLLQNPYFFCENGKEFSWREVAEQVGKSLKDRGLLENAEPKEYSEEDWEELFGEYTGAVIGLNSRSRAVRLRELGWEAKEKGIWESWVEDELPELLKEEGLGKASRYAGTVAS
ncbi:NAD(P)-binding protein [Paraphaeosphaeria sporulosa]|uniref:NAD(P)-binding protein n=1 Tax=Paraphaeosphaeria sporulosa TaxID=1460663 RepID=A0A177CQG1_9PLEO|nr:NAD(P)-binding protein [Paraphaeosphaeria sporulosa]OAG09461.1 NAD(P)-binding protein [Paraphaeosphaeria sporulosa]